MKVTSRPIQKKNNKRIQECNLIFHIFTRIYLNINPKTNEIMAQRFPVTLKEYDFGEMLLQFRNCEKFFVLASNKVMRKYLKCLK